MAEPVGPILIRYGLHRPRLDWFRARLDQSEGNDYGDEEKQIHGNGED